MFGQDVYELHSIVSKKNIKASCTFICFIGLDEMLTDCIQLFVKRI
jgi:hypothetical protein